MFGIVTNPHRTPRRKLVPMSTVESQSMFSQLTRDYGLDMVTAIEQIAECARVNRETIRDLTPEQVADLTSRPTRTPHPTHAPAADGSCTCSRGPYPVEYDAAHLIEVTRNEYGGYRGPRMPDATVTPAYPTRAPAATPHTVAHAPVDPTARVFGPVTPVRYGNGYAGILTIAGMLSRHETRPRVGDR